MYYLPQHYGFDTGTLLETTSFNPANKQTPTNFNFGFYNLDGDKFVAGLREFS